MKRQNRVKKGNTKSTEKSEIQQDCLCYYSGRLNSLETVGLAVVTPLLELILSGRNEKVVCSLALTKG